ncbi:MULTISPECIES: hypothetical protein [Cupriavidus]|uniref:hypothetical protein n=1 Tax=Cupriavidus sp. DF5525 TaxID=3160989 RepID=UPI0032DEF084
MASPYNLPDEYLQGFIQSGQSLWLAMMLNPAAQVPGSSDAPSVQPGAGPFAGLQWHYFQQQFALWTRMLASMADRPPEAEVAPERGDRPFSAVEWRDNPFYSLLKQSYLLNARLAEDMVEAAAFD